MILVQNCTHGYRPISLIKLIFKIKAITIKPFPVLKLRKLILTDAEQIFGIKWDSMHIIFTNKYTFR